LPTVDGPTNLLLPSPTRNNNTHVHTLPVSPVREFRQCTSVRRVATLVLFFAPTSFRLLLATSGCCCCFGWGVVVRCSCHVKRRPLSRTS
jgi:hypothetical protein